MNEYDCWFQRRREPLPPERAAVLRLITAIPGSGPDAALIAQAVEECERGARTMFGVEPERPTDGRVVGGVIIGTIARMNEILGLDLPAQKPEGFVLRTVNPKGRPEDAPPLIAVAGADGRGCLYGVFRLLFALAQNIWPDDPAGIADGIADAPASPWRVLNHWDGADGVVVRGYAGPSLFFGPGGIDYDPERVRDYARLLASIGINCVSLNNVNVQGGANALITTLLPGLAGLAGIFRPYGIQLLLSINFAAPWVLGDLDTADPLDARVRAWWADRAGRIYQAIPDLAGFLVKADSEGEPGPFQYGRTHADGANMLAEALAPHGGTVFWRCFVYNCTQDWRDPTVDRARAAYDHFMPLDGAFAANVILQIKFGPYDFQVREPVSPLFGALKRTRHVMELQVTQEYTGHQIDLCYLPWIWERILAFDTRHHHPGGSRIRDLLASGAVEGLAAVANTGRDRNWTGHTLAQANLYGYGRLAWNPAMTADAIAREWTALSVGQDAAPAVTGILLKSYPTYEKYNAPFGVCFMVTPHLHYGPSVEGYEFSKWGTYHRANHEAIGIDRTPAGTGYTAQYAPENAAIFADPARCPEPLILFFHRLRYDHVMRNGKTLLQNIYDRHFEGFEEVEAMIAAWKALEGRVGPEVFSSVLARMERQRENAREWRDQVNTYFFRHTGVGDEGGRKIYD